MLKAPPLKAPPAKAPALKAQPPRPQPQPALTSLPVSAAMLRSIAKP
jgi:hypothetical protein